MIPSENLVRCLCTVDSPLHQKELEKEVTNLTHEVVYTSDIYFGRVKEHVSLLYSNLDLRSQMDFIKVVCGGHLVDEEAVASL